MDFTALWLRGGLRSTVKNLSVLENLFRNDLDFPRVSYWPTPARTGTAVLPPSAVPRFLVVLFFSFNFQLSGVCPDNGKLRLFLL
jgi:hypothetical protein